MQPRALRITAAVIATLSVIAGILAASPLLPVEVRGWIALGVSIAVVVQTRLPQIWGLPDAPAAEPPRVADAVVKPAIVLCALALTACDVRAGYGPMLAVALAAPVVVLMAGVVLGLGRRGPLVLVALLLALPAYANPILPGVALPPGPVEVAAEAQRPQQPAPQPSVYQADRGPLQVSPMLLAQLAAAPVLPPAAAPSPAPSPVALNPNIPICPDKPPAPPTTLGKVEKWLYVAGAVIALASVTAEKLDAIVSGRASVTP